MKLNESLRGMMEAERAELERALLTDEMPDETAEASSCDCCLSRVPRSDVQRQVLEHADRLALYRRCSECLQAGCVNTRECARLPAVTISLRAIAIAFTSMDSRLGEVADLVRDALQLIGDAYRDHQE